MAKTKIKKLTKKEQAQVQDARCFAALMRLEKATAQQIADEAGDTNSGEFCTEGQARAAMTRFIDMGLVWLTDDKIKTGRRAQTGYQPSPLASAMAYYLELGA